MDHTVLPANTPHLPLPVPLPRSSPEGATTDWTVIAPADEAYYSLIDPVRMKRWFGLVGWLTADGLRGYPSAAECRSGADQWKFAGQRPTFYHWATEPHFNENKRTFSNIDWEFVTTVLKFVKIREFY